SDPRKVAARRVVPTTGRIPPRAVYTDSASVRVSPTSPQRYLHLETVTAVGINLSQERAPYFQSTGNSCTPNGYGVPERHTLGAFAPIWTFLCQHHHSVRPPVLDQISPAPSVPAVNPLLAL